MIIINSTFLILNFCEVIKLKLLTLILTIVVIILIKYIINIKKELRSISRQIENTKGEYINIHIGSMDKDLENVAININYLYDQWQKINVQRKDIEEELRQSIANMSHDLRTPLTSILGYLQLVKEGDITLKEKKEYLEIIYKRTKALQKLISNFYDLSRLEGNEYKFNMRKLNLSNILCESIALYYNDLTIKNIEPIIEIEKNIPLIISDENAVIRIFSNLIGNMLKYGEKYIKISIKREGEFIMSEFINYAPSLDITDGEKLFERFFTMDKSRSDKNTGLGLSITKALVNQLGNEIKAEIIDSHLIIKIKWKI